MNILRIAVVGAECTGKSQLCQQLAQEFPALTFEEPLRSWVRKHGKPPTANEQIQLIQWQQQAENQALAQASDRGLKLVICDSAPLVTAVYSDLYYQDTSLYGVAIQHHQLYHLTLWCQPDIPWQADPGMRDGEIFRQQTHRLLNMAIESRLVKSTHRPMLKNSDTDLVQVDGLGDNRLQNAKQAIDKAMCFWING